MKKRIAVLANGWNNINLLKSLEGIKRVCQQYNADCFLFLSFAVYGRTVEHNDGETNIFYLPELDDFDGLIVHASFLESVEYTKKLKEHLEKVKIPAVSIGKKISNMHFIDVDNYTGAYNLYCHLIEEHHIKNPVFIAGPEGALDSNERIQAAKDAFSKHGMTLPENRIFYADWIFEKEKEIAAEICNSFETLPDAFICANDHTAMACCLVLQEKGYKIPQDTLVTGFDNALFCKTFYPSISTVDQNYEQIGEIACNNLMRQIDGKEARKSIQVPSVFMINESCGCKKTSEMEDFRHAYCNERYKEFMEFFDFSNHINNISKCLFPCRSANDLAKYTEEFFKKEHFFEGNNFYYIADRTATKTFSSDNKTLRTEGYSDQLDCIFAMEEGEIKHYSTFTRKALLPHYEEDTEKNHVFLFCPIHFKDKVFGYLVFKDREDLLLESQLPQYLNKINNTLEEFRQTLHLENLNKQLLNISVRDSLTELYNRFGLEKMALPLYEESKAEKKNCVLIFIDINRMKFINDRFGHLQGDLAVRTVAHGISSVIPENWIAIRYGGDEFLILGVEDKNIDPEKMIEKINQNIYSQVNHMALPYPLTASCGFVVTDYTSNQKLDDYIKYADSVMYEHKKQTYLDEKKESGK